VSGMNDNQTNNSLEQIEAFIRAEEDEQQKRYDNKGTISLKELREAGVLLYPIRIVRKTFSAAGKPMITIKSIHDYDQQSFQTGASVVLKKFDQDDQCTAHIVYTHDDASLTVHLQMFDFPDWIEAKNIGVQLQPDRRSFKCMRYMLKKTAKSPTRSITTLLEGISNPEQAPEHLTSETKKTTIVEDQGLAQNKSLNNIQASALQESTIEQPLFAIHGPPGTGKTKTLSAIIQTFVKQNKRVIATAPSNTAVDHLAQQLINANMKVFRLGNTAKVDETITPYTPEGILSEPDRLKQLKKLRIGANALRKKASQYKRQFTAQDRQNRKEWYNEARSIQSEIKRLTNYYLERALEKADVILGTPVGLQHDLILDQNFDVALIDEAGQCLIPMGMLVMNQAKRTILCGDHQQLPPTVLSESMSKKWVASSLLEFAIHQGTPYVQLHLQYRMPPSIAQFSSSYFYQNNLISTKQDKGVHLQFFDTAGAGFTEERSFSNSFFNTEELRSIQTLIEREKSDNILFISPYAAQVEKCKSLLNQDVDVSTIDGIQGQEAKTVIVSLVRSNKDSSIGFLSEYRRMNVALTRASDRLIVFGDSSTIGQDPFYQSFLEYVESINGYHSVFELLYD